MDSSSKIDILREIQRELEIRKSWKPFFLSEHLSIEFDVSNKVLYCHWKGELSEALVMPGCEKILEALPVFHCSKVLNDSADATGACIPDVSWIVEDWFPRMVIAGLKKFAWIYPPSVFSRVSINELLHLIEENKMIKIFSNLPAGMQWLMTSRD